MIYLIARAIIYQKGKYFLVRNKGAKHWCLPGGRVEPQEAIEQALERELVEELGVRPLLGQLLYVQQLFLRSGEQRVEFFFMVNNPEDYMAADITKTSHGFELDEVSFTGLRNVEVLPNFLTTELPGLLKNYTPGSVPHFRLNEEA
jgi:ADP-ribose pyrophosphatase YjhB (NUDIX family)